jgi:hypothetical protein
MSIARPRVTEEMILEAAKLIANKLDNADADTIAQYYRHHMDGYELARELDKWCGRDFTMSDVEELDGMSSIVDDLHRQAEERWFKDNDIQPTLPVGTRIKQGVIEGICQYSAAKYLVKENGCAQKNRFLLIQFEDAVAV